MDELKTQPPSKKLMDAFDLGDKCIPLSGGLHGAFRAGDVVLKKVDEPNFYDWICENVLNQPFQGVRVPTPIKSKTGAWSFDGWCAYFYLEGELLEAGLSQKLEILRSFNSSLRDITGESPPIPESPWSRAEKYAWQESKLSALFPKELKTLVELAGDDTSASQHIHSDPCGNILDHPNYGPAMIDITITKRPTSFSEAILIYDSILWGKGSIDDVRDWMMNDSNLNALVRAATFRLFTTHEFDILFGRSNFATEKNLFWEYFGAHLPKF